MTFWLCGFVARQRKFDVGELLTIPKPLISGGWGNGGNGWGNSGSGWGGG
jgi:hypothetical protein